MTLLKKSAYFLISLGILTSSENVLRLEEHGEGHTAAREEVRDLRFWNLKSESGRLHTHAIARPAAPMPNHRIKERQAASRHGIGENVRSMRTTRGYSVN